MTHIFLVQESTLTHFIFPPQDLKHLSPFFKTSTSLHQEKYNISSPNWTLEEQIWAQDIRLFLM